MPEYMGSVRVMVVASAENAFVSAQKNIQVSAPVVMLESLPRSLKIGDSFTLLAQSVEFGESMSKDIILEANVSNSNIGMKTLEFELKTKDYTYKDECRLILRL